MRFHIIPGSFEMSRKVVTGEICIKVGNKFFPEKRWNDFAIGILNGWLRSLQPYIAEESTEAIFMFMDGPFELTLVENRNSIVLVGYRNGLSERTIFVERIIDGPKKRKILITIS